MIKPKRLSKSELEEVLRPMRQWQSYQMHEVAKLVSYIRWLEDELDRVHAAQSPTLFAEVKPIKAQYLPFKKPGNENHKFPLKKRLKLMLEANETNTHEWQQTLKWNRLTHDEAMKLASEDDDP